MLCYVAVTPLRHWFLHSCIYGEILSRAKIDGQIYQDEYGLLSFILLLTGRHRFIAGSSGLAALLDETDSHGTVLPTHVSTTTGLRISHAAWSLASCCGVPSRYHRGNVSTWGRHPRTECLQLLKRSYWKGRTSKGSLTIKSRTPQTASVESEATGKNTISRSCVHNERRCHELHLTS